MASVARKINNLLFRWRYAREHDLIRNIRKQALTYCGYGKLENLVASVHRVARRRVPGIFLEAGVALGGSAIVLAKSKPESVPLELYDVFGLIPPPTHNDGDDAHQRYSVIKSGQSDGLGGSEYYGYMDDLQTVVTRNLEQFGVDLERDRVRLNPGLFDETLDVQDPVAIAHVDCDWHDSVKVCLDRIAPKLSVQGEMVFDDYSSYSGCRKAVDRFLETQPSFRLVNARRSATIRRVA